MSWFDFLIDPERAAARREKAYRAEYMHGFDYGAGCVLLCLDDGLDKLRQLVEDGGAFDREVHDVSVFDKGVREAQRIGARILDNETHRRSLIRKVHDQIAEETKAKINLKHQL